MNTLDAFAMGMANRNKPLMTFDWDRAAQIIKERKPKVAEAGLQGDLEWTGGTIYQNDEPSLNCYIYLSSTWAKPLLILDGEEIECWRWQSETSWDSGTKWPESSLKILKGG